MKTRNAAHGYALVVVQKDMFQKRIFFAVKNARKTKINKKKTYQQQPNTNIFQFWIFFF